MNPFRLSSLQQRGLAGRLNALNMEQTCESYWSSTVSIELEA